MNSLLKYPSVWVPFVISLANIVLIVSQISVFGFVREADEGVAAHVFQLSMAVQAFVVTFFAVRWIPKNPKEALPIFIFQIGVALLVFCLLFYLESVAFS